MPPLRERGDDVLLLADHFLKHSNRELGKAVDGMAPEALELLQRYPWPGNVRELQSVIKQALLQTKGPVLLPEFLPASLRSQSNPWAASPAVAQPNLADLTCFIQEQLQRGSTSLYADLLALVERQVLGEVLRHTAGNRSQAAKILGITRPTLRAMLIALRLAAEQPAGAQDE